MNIEFAELLRACFETFYMVSIAALLALVVGLPLGFCMVLSSPGHLMPNRLVHMVLGAVINVFRSVPFVILMIVLMPLTKRLVGTSIGMHAAVVPLAFGATPFFARLVEMALRDLPAGMIQMGRALGATHWQIVRHILFPEARAQMVAGVIMMAVALVGYSAMAGLVGGGGLGDLAIRHGYQRFQTDVMVLTTVIMVILVQVLQTLGNYVSTRLDRR